MLGAVRSLLTTVLANIYDTLEFVKLFHTYIYIYILFTYQSNFGAGRGDTCK